MHSALQEEFVRIRAGVFAGVSKAIKSETAENSGQSECFWKERRKKNECHWNHKGWLFV